MLELPLYILTYVQSFSGRNPDEFFDYIDQDLTSFFYDGCNDAIFHDDPDEGFLIPPVGEVSKELLENNRLFNQTCRYYIDDSSRIYALSRRMVEAIYHHYRAISLPIHFSPWNASWEIKGDRIVYMLDQVSHDEEGFLQHEEDLDTDLQRRLVYASRPARF